MLRNNARPGNIRCDKATCDLAPPRRNQFMSTDQVRQQVTKHKARRLLKENTLPPCSEYTKTSQHVPPFSVAAINVDTKSPSLASRILMYLVVPELLSSCRTVQPNVPQKQTSKNSSWSNCQMAVAISLCNHAAIRKQI